MILKVQTNDSMEVIDGFDRVSYKEIPKGKPIAVSSDYWDFTGRQETEGEEQNELNTTMEIWLYKGNQVVKQIISYRPVYILNNEGKTVERI